jgi:hypothetical protein
MITTIQSHCQIGGGSGGRVVSGSEVVPVMGWTPVVPSARQRALRVSFQGVQ